MNLFYPGSEQTVINSESFHYKFSVHTAIRDPSWVSFMSKYGYGECQSFLSHQIERNFTSRARLSTPGPSTSYARIDNVGQILHFTPEKKHNSQALVNLEQGLLCWDSALKKS